MSDADRRRQQSADLAKAAREWAYATDITNPEWQRKSEQYQRDATQRLADTPEKREQQRTEYLEEVRRQERWDAEDRDDDEQAERYRETLRDKRRKERDRDG